MTEKDWITAFIQQSEAVMTLWIVYIIVILGVVGFVIQRGAAITKSERLLFIIAFTFFAISNGYPLYEAQDTLVQIKEQLDHKTMFTANRASIVISVHLIFDLIIIGLLSSWPFKFSD